MMVRAVYRERRESVSPAFREGIARPNNGSDVIGPLPSERHCAAMAPVQAVITRQVGSLRHELVSATFGRIRTARQPPRHERHEVSAASYFTSWLLWQYPIALQTGRRRGGRRTTRRSSHQT